MDGNEKWLKLRKLLSSDAAEEEKKSNIMYRGDNGRTCLHLVCCYGAPDDIIKGMLDIGGKELVMKIDDNDATVLNYACTYGASYNIMKMLIEVGGKDLVMAKSDNGNTVLHDLCWNIEKHNDADDKIKLILKVGDANLLPLIKDNNGQTPLEIATKYTDKGASNDDIVKTMLDIGGKELVMKVDDDDCTVLHDACAYGSYGASYNIIKMLIEVGGKDLVMAKDKDGNTALHHLCWSIEEDTKVAEKIMLILQIDDDNVLLSTKNHYAGQTPLEIATDKGASNIIKNLLTVQKVDLENNVQTPLEIVTDKGASNDIIKKLLTEHKEGEGAVVQSQTQSSKRRKVGNTRNALSGSLDTNQAEGEDAELIDLLMTRYLDTRKQLKRANARIAQLEEEHAGT
jgi:ankyrin repeat protein